MPRRATRDVITQRMPGSRVDVPDVVRANAAWLIVGACCLVLLVLGLHEIRTRSIWFDEALTIDLARRPWDAFLDEITRRELNGVVHTLLLRALNPLGDDEFAARLPSVVFAVATIPLLFAVGRRHVGVQAAMFGCALFATSAFVIEYAQEVRTYALTMFAATLIVLLWSRAAETGGVGRWVAFGATAAIAPYVHFFLGFVIAALGMLLVAGIAARTRAAMLAHGAVLVATIPVAIFVVTTEVTMDWIPPLTRTGMRVVLVSLAGESAPLAVLVYALAGVGVAATVVGSRSRPEIARRVRRLAPIVACCVVPIAGGIAVSVVKSLIISRYFIVALPPLMLLTGAGLAALTVRVGGRRVPFGVAGLGLAFVLSAPAVAAWYAEPRWDWRGAAAWVAGEAEPGDRIVYLRENGRIPFGYYYEPAGTPLRAITAATAAAEPGRTWFVHYDLPDEDLASFRETTRGYRVAVHRPFTFLEIELLVPAVDPGG